jgi:broad specificity phosphatase PhoE
MHKLILAAFISLALAMPALAQQTVFVVRHAERADAGTSSGSMMASDPELSDAGHARAKALAAMLKDANITAIFTTEFKRTQQTAEPLARLLGIQSTPIGSRDPQKLLEAIKDATGNVLVVGHSNTVPAVIKGLGVSTAVELGDSEYDNLFIVKMGATPSLVRLHFH